MSGRTSLILVLAMGAPFAGVAIAADEPNFTVSPQTPTVGQSVTFAATGTDRQDTVEWDFEGDGSFEATGTTLQHVYRTAGRRTVLMRVGRPGGRFTDITKAVLVKVSPTSQQRPPPVPVGPRLMSPFPVVRIIGRSRPRGTRISRLTVGSAPRGAFVTVRCRGGGCPRRRARRIARSGDMRFRSLERPLRAGAVIRVYVTQRGRIGKYTSFEIRRTRPPVRRDRCVTSVRAKPGRCPSV